MDVQLEASPSQDEPIMEYLSVEVCAENLDESELRIRIGNHVKYIVIDPGLIDPYIICFAPDFIPLIRPLLPTGDWTSALVFGNPESLTIEPLHRPLDGVRSQWHTNTVEVLDLTILSRMSDRLNEVKFGLPDQPVVAVSKFSCFEWEIYRVEQETEVYRALAGHGIGPAFLGHLAENGRIMGFLIEKIKGGRRADIGDLEACQKAVRRLHALGIVHGDLNRHNFIISLTGEVTLIDFENSWLEGTHEEMDFEYDNLSAQLQEDEGRGERRFKFADEGEEEDSYSRTELVGLAKEPHRECI
ncbi:hypothetical protein DXG03_009176 [Asterophora parasitica]|uniref:Alpha-galactosidase A n=1 Tax=Asterophora parasitica TaxID=117018 RepID=A0A9P7G010_9AGAR|nr:hypothetical protein DXG03_009176 [Asterophora parasitica]